MTKSTASSDGPSPDEPALIGKWVNRLTRVTGKREQVKCLTMLARHVRSETGRLAVLEQLARREPNGARLALMFLSRLPERLPATLISQVIPLLQDDRISSTIRITAAGLCLEAVPDRAAHVQPILSAITHGLPRTQILERLIRLQKRVQNCQTLDQTIEQTEQQIHYRCSSCKRSFPRRQFIQHLWVQHRLTFQRGRILEPQPIVEQAINAASQSGAVDDLDRAFALSRMYYPDVPIYQVLQAIAARSPADPSQLDRLREVAAAQAAGLCPICLTALPDPIPRLPPPLSLSAHRLAGDGYAVEVMMRNGVRSITIRTPTEEWFPSQSFSRWPGRTIGAMVATFILVIAIFFTLVIPGDSWALWVVACGMVGWAWLGYAAARWLVPALPEARAEAVRLAWEKFVPGIGRRPPAVRFLIRLCRSSLGEGHVRERVAVVGEMVEQAAILADKGPLYLQFLAAVRVLQVYDAAVLGRDRVSGLAALFEPIFRGEISPIFAEAVAELLLDPPGLLRHGERGRLAVLLLHSAFPSGILPVDLHGIGPFLPWITRLLGEPDRQTLEAMHILWQESTGVRPGKSPLRRTIFDLARSAPTESALIQAQFPDAWFVLECDPANRAILGPVVVGPSGLTIAGKRLMDAAEPLEQVPDAQGRWCLFFGKHQIELRQKLPTAFLQELRRGLRDRLRIREEAIARAESTTFTPRTALLLAPLVQTCSLCQSAVIVRTGILGAAWTQFVVNPRG